MNALARSSVARTTLRAVLLGLVVVSVSAWARRTLRSGPPAAEGAAVLPDAGVAVVNFHGSLRCETCLRIGALSRATVERGFAAELADGRVSWTEVDFDQPGQAHFRDAYDIFASTVVVVARRDGQDVGWERVDEVWELYDDEVAFRARLGAAIERRLAELGR